MVFFSHILTFYYSVALLCSAKKVKSETKILIFRFNQKSLNQLMYFNETQLFRSNFFINVKPFSVQETSINGMSSL